MSPRPRHLIAALLALALAADAQEFRAMWADAFHDGMKTSAQVTSLVAAARTANCNALVVQIRKRGDAYYRNGLEPVATDVAGGFDPLADLLFKAHTGTPRIDVHAWFVTYNIWNNQTTAPSQPTHPYNVHPEWLSQKNTGALWDGGNYQFDQGHPEVQQYTYDVVMDVLTRYDIDGIHFDYIRYSDDSTLGSQPWGYHPVSVARFKAQTGTSTTPAPTDAAWLQWRRDQVTAFLRKVYVNAWDAKPNVRVSASNIVYGNAPADLTLAAWQSSEPYRRVLQDWRAWMEEGILDLACPMIYTTSNTRFTGWANFTKDRQYSRAGAMGMGWYMNTLANTNTQVGIARATSPNSNNGIGIVGYSYGVPNSAGTSQSATWTDFVANSFPTAVAVPAMPWKTNVTKGHLMGEVLDPSGAAVDGFTITLTGPVNRTLKTDGTGWFGSVDLPVGTYTITFTVPGYRPVTKTVTITGAQVAEPAITLEKNPFIITSSARNPTANTLTVTWNSFPGRTYRLERSLNLSQWFIVQSGIPATQASTTYVATLPAGWTDTAFVRVREE